MSMYLGCCSNSSSDVMVMYMAGFVTIVSAMSLTLFPVTDAVTVGCS